MLKGLGLDNQIIESSGEPRAYNYLPHGYGYSNEQLEIFEFSITIIGGFIFNFWF
jgi:hypothetical protein